MYAKLWHESARQPGKRLALHWWKSRKGEIPLRGYVWIVHGMGEHGARYAEFATYLTKLGFDVLAPDLHGHGLSRTEGNSPLALTVPEQRAELQDLLRFWMVGGPVAAKGAAKAPWYLVAHSLGALTSLEWILRGKKDASDLPFASRAFLAAPPLRLRLPVPAWKNAGVVLLGGMFPNVKVANGIKPEHLSYDAANVAAYRADPLVHDEATPRGYLSLLSTANEVMGRPQDIEIPVCLAVGADDPIVDPGAVREYFDTLRTHKKFLQFPNCKHEVFNDLDRARCFEAAVSWFL